MKNPFVSLDVASSPVHAKNRLHKAWEDFMVGKQQEPGIRPLMLESWQRCQSSGVHPVKGKAPLLLPPSKIEEFFSENPFYRIVEPFLLKLNDVAVESGHMVVFCNEQADIVYLRGDKAVTRKAERMNFIPGASWAEHNIGTNAIGTALETGSPIQVFASEHYCQDVHGWACSAAPIRDPATKQILGVIDLTGLWNVIHPHSLSAVVSTAHAIEFQLLHQLQNDHFRLLETFLEMTTHQSQMYMAVLDRGCSVVKASPIFYEQGWIDKENRLVGCPYQSLSLASRRSWEVEGKNGRWTFELVPHTSDQQLIGAIVLISPPPTRSQPVPHQNTKHSFSSLIGSSPLFLAAIAEARAAAGTNLPVLIEGESGTGKELLAQSIHAASCRASMPFVAVNCGAIPKELAVSEFFGYEEGTFTGSSKGGKIGKFQQAEGGTIFLDEIGDMPLELQTILLRVLEEGEVVRIGGRRSVKLNVRIISATNMDLNKAIQNGTFRKDLYYRLNILSVRVPALRDRTDDIPQLIEHHLNRAGLDLGRAPVRIDHKAMDVLQQYHWPGNVRELRNFAYRMVSKVQGDTITLDHLPDEIKNAQTRPDPEALPAASAPCVQPKKPSKTQSLKDRELQTILHVLSELNGNVSETAKRLGIHRSTIYRKLGRNPSKHF